jgi:flagellar biosynthesis anti-sigma factor FlgM
MAIDRLTGVDGYSRPDRLTDDSPAGGQVRRAPRHEGDRLELSPDAQRISVLVDRALALPEIRLDEVEAVREILARGPYSVDSRRLAGAILEFEDALDR